VTREAQKQRERQLFELFRAEFGGPQGDIDDSGEKPDLVVSAAISVGVEVTELHVLSGSDPVSWQRQSARRTAAIDLARSQYEQSGGPFFEFHFDLRRPLPSELSVGKLAAECLAAAHASLATEGGAISPLVLEGVAPNVRWLYRSPKEYDAPRWTDLTVHAVPQLNVERLQEVVDTKAEKLAGYRHCDEQWLLVVIDFWNAGQDQQLDWPDSAVLRRRGFDRVFVFKTGHVNWIEPASAP
jgi:hypothetical protein